MIKTLKKYKNSALALVVGLTVSTVGVFAETPLEPGEEGYEAQQAGDAVTDMVASFGEIFWANIVYILAVMGGLIALGFTVRAIKRYIGSK